MNRRRVRRDFDLSRVGDEEQRINLARRYIETTDKIRQFDAHFRLLRRPRDLQRNGKTNLNVDGIADGEGL